MNRFLPLLLAGILTSGIATAQQVNCGTTEAMQEYYSTHPAALSAMQQFEQSTKQSTNGQAKGTAAKYIIPIVFHVYGTTQGGYTINDPLIKLALKGLNDDFKGRNADFGLVHNQFKPVRDTMDIEFVLPTKDPAGNATSGIVYYAQKKGYGKASASNAAIAADAWDNYRYVNVYVMEDIYDDGILNNSGVAWYPDKTMSDNKVARIIYNGTYLATNNIGNPEFASVISHEFGHFFNLIHTFDGGCTAPNDSIADTPPCITAQGCHSSSSSNAPLNCNNTLINAENYMDYNTNCYRMFTQGQVARMKTALTHPARVTLWQDSNLVKVGVLPTPGSVHNTHATQNTVSVYPNPAHEHVTIHIHAAHKTMFNISVADLTGRTISDTQADVQAGDNAITIPLKDMPAGIYLLRVSSDTDKQVLKLEVR